MVDSYIVCCYIASSSLRFTNIWLLTNVLQESVTFTIKAWHASELHTLLTSDSVKLIRYVVALNLVCNCIQESDTPPGYCIMNCSFVDTHNGLCCCNENGITRNKITPDSIQLYWAMMLRSVINWWVMKLVYELWPIARAWDYVITPPDLFTRHFLISTGKHQFATLNHDRHYWTLSMTNFLFS